MSANVPIFSALTIEADVRGAWSQYRQAGLNQSQADRQVADDVNQNYRNLMNSREKIARAAGAGGGGPEGVRPGRARLRASAPLSNLDRLTQQDNLLTARLNLVSEQFNEKSNYLGLLRASGGLGSAVGSP